MTFEIVPNRYVPTDWADKVELTLEEVSELNSLNMELSVVLAEKNPVFTSFQHGNFSCIMIKEVGLNWNGHSHLAVSNLYV